MAIARTGNVETFLFANNASSQSITVPDDAEIAIVAVVLVRDVDNYIDLGNAADASTASLTLAATQMKVGRCHDSTAEAPANYQIGIFYLVSPTIGVQTLAWDWNGSNDCTAGARFYYAFYKGIDIDSPIESRGGAKGIETANTGAMSVTDGSFIVAAADCYTGYNIGWTNATEVREDSGNIVGAYAENSSSSGSVTVTMATDPDQECGIVALVLKAAAGGGGDGPWVMILR